MIASTLALFPASAEIPSQASAFVASEGRSSIEVTVRIYNSASDHFVEMTGIQVPLALLMLGSVLVAVSLFAQSFAALRAE